jgi:hypothetical protein
VAPKLKGVNLVGYAETVQNLQRFDKETLKVLNAEIYQTVKTTVKEARTLVPIASPLSGWGKPILIGKWKDRVYNSGKVKSGIKSKIGRQRTRGFGQVKQSLYNQQTQPAQSMKLQGAKTLTALHLKVEILSKLLKLNLV